MNLLIFLTILWTCQIVCPCFLMKCTKENNENNEKKLPKASSKRSSFLSTYAAYVKDLRAVTELKRNSSYLAYKLNRSLKGPKKLWNDYLKACDYYEDIFYNAARVYKKEDCPSHQFLHVERVKVEIERDKDNNDSLRKTSGKKYYENRLPYWIAPGKLGAISSDAVGTNAAFIKEKMKSLCDAIFQKYISTGQPLSTTEYELNPYQNVICGDLKRAFFASSIGGCVDKQVERLSGETLDVFLGPRNTTHTVYLLAVDNYFGRKYKDHRYKIVDYVVENEGVFEFN